MARLPQPPRTVRSVLQQQQRQIRAQGTSSAFTRSGMNVTQEGEVASDEFDGNLDTRDAGTNGWAMNGQVAAFGDVLFRPGSIGNDSLSSPVSPNIVYAATSGFAVPKAGMKVVSDTLVVPDGYTTAIIIATSKIHAYNNGADLDYLYSQLFIGPFSGANTPEACSGSNGSISSIAPLSVYMEGLSGGNQVEVYARASTSFAGWDAVWGNTAELSGSVLWFR